LFRLALLMLRITTDIAAIGEWLYLPASGKPAHYMSICVPERFVNEFYERFRITDEEELAGTYALVLGTLRISQSGKKYVEAEDLGIITLR
jgi:hypothetical protein